MKIIVYAIAKNESKFVDRWMDSMSEADEVVVLDTGSTDDTVEKLRARGAKVTVETVEPWRFDTARNRSMELAPDDADILVCTDPDEVLLPGWRAALERAWKPGATTAMYEYVWSFNPDGTDDRKFTYEKVHAPGVCKWAHPVHEVLEYSVPKVTVRADMRLEHHPDPLKSRSQYLGLLEMSVSEDPADDRNLHYLGREYMFRGMYDKAVAALRNHLACPNATWAPERAQSMRFIGRCLRNTGDLDGAELWLRRAVDECPTRREPAYELMRLLYDRKDWRGVVETGRRMLSVTTRDMSYLTEQDAWGYGPHDILSVAYWSIGDRASSLMHLRKAMESGGSTVPRIAANAARLLGGR